MTKSGFVLGGPGVSLLKCIRQKLDDSPLPGGPPEDLFAAGARIDLSRIPF